MKKRILLSVFIFFCSLAFSQDFYFWINSDDFDVADRVMEKVVEKGRKEGFSIRKSDVPKPDEFIDFSYTGEMTDEELLEAIDEEKKEKAAGEEQLKSMGMTVKTFGESKSIYELELELRKKNKENKEKFKYPYFEFSFSSDYSEWTDENKFSLEGTLWSSENQSEYISYEFFLKKENDSAIIDEYAEKIISIARAKQKSKVKEEVPYLVDFVRVPDYFDYTLNSDQRINTILVTARDDYSYCVTEGKSVRLYDAYGSYAADLHEQIKDEDRKLSTWWYGCSPDGSSFVFANSGSNRSYHFEKDGRLKKSLMLNLPKAYVFGLSAEGFPFVYNMMNENAVSVSGLSDDEITRIEIANRSVEKIFITKNRELYLYSRGNFSVRDYKGRIKKCVSILNKSDHSEYPVHVFDDGSMLFYSMNNQNVKKYDADGKLIFTLHLPSSIMRPRFQDYKKGMYYFSDDASGTVWRFADKTARLPDALVEISKLNQKYQLDPKSHENLLKAADIYFSNGAALASYSALLAYLDHCPGDSAALEKKIRTEISFGKVDAGLISKKALDLLDEYGEESAKVEYSRAMKILEKLKKYAPDDYELNRMYADLKNEFYPENSVAAAVPAVKVESVHVAPIFPAKMNSYASEKNALVVLKNGSEKTIRNVKVSAMIRKYMDFPSDGIIIAELKKNETAEIPLLTQINSNVLSLSEDINVQIQFTAAWEEDGKLNKMNFSRPIVIYRKSAMDWGNLAMISCFVLPNNETVSSFVFENAGKSSVKTVSKNIGMALQISNALGEIPLNYISDPVAPAVDQVGNKYAIDTVRFPFETLEKKGGDCDDMTVLLCSLFESAGIPAAVITTPGHIFAAFDSGLERSSVSDRIEKTTSLRFVPEELAGSKKLWIPVEATCLSKGFYESWKLASSEMTDKSGSPQIEEFVVISDLKADYPPVSATSATKNISLNKKQIERINSDEAKKIHDDFKKILEELADVSMDPMELNKISKMCYSIGDVDCSLKALDRAVKINPSFRAGYLNLANIYKAKGDMKNYDLYVTKAEKSRGSGSSLDAVAESKKQPDVVRASGFDGLFQWEE